MESARLPQPCVSSGSRTGRSLRFGVAVPLLLLPLASAGVLHPADKLTDDEKIALVRDLSSEYAKTMVPLPRSRKALEFNADGTWDKKKWQQVQMANGNAARGGEEVQITKITLEGDSILLEINGGVKSGRTFMDHVQIGVGMPQPVTNGQSGTPTQGTTIELKFAKPMEGLTPDAVKEILAPILDFDKRTVTKLYSETIPPEVADAITEKHAVVGMTRDQVLMAMGHPEHKYRETKNGVDTEDWIYGTPPGKVTFVTFRGPKVAKVKDEYAGLGIETHADQPAPAP